ncbi:odorant receptor 49b-like [Pectinophora gossypiella]|uniref:odorant receptor 49b-like n=1 Tax=Pectinophora gossypiella TaxID=13191 RepID=UPI00214E1367|nr:odorant receptor 49b-like [Pectinophora gossypiella]
MCFNAMVLAVGEGIALAAYEASWYTWPVDLQKDLLLVIRAAQRPFTIKAGGLVPISIQTFGQMLNKGYSIFAVLNDAVDQI